MKTKHAKFSEKTNISYPLIRACTCAYQWGKKCSFVKRFGVLCFLETPILRFALLPYYRCYPVLMASQIEEDLKVHKVDNSWHYKHLTANFFWKFELYKFPLTLIKRSKNRKLFFVCNYLYQWFLRTKNEITDSVLSALMEHSLFSDAYYSNSPKISFL